jgi:predicted metal-dependent enzyme (double-stranded beta helix superfamily)
MTTAPTLERPLTPAALLGVVRKLARDAPTWRALARHDPDERWFLRLAAHDRFDTWLIGWAPHQGVDLHDHGGSSGALYVVDGVLQETGGRRDGAGLHDQRLVAGTARAFGRTHVHRVVNTSSQVATSIHVYSPPLVTMDFYERDASTLTHTHSELALSTRSGRGEIR